jgi:hypothetical protein
LGTSNNQAKDQGVEMKNKFAKITFAFAIMATLVVLASAVNASKPAATAAWSLNATAIEACSCPMFCQCYFNTKPAGHHANNSQHSHGSAGATHFCRANLAYKVNKGHFGEIKLDGGKFWVITDLGADFSKGKMDWAKLYFDKKLTPEQRNSIGQILPNVFPVEWGSFETAEGDIDRWEFTTDSAHATLNSGKTAEVQLQRVQGMTDQPVVINNLRYWGAPRNDGFILMPNVVEAYREGPKAFEFKGTNGFLITIDINSDDVAATKKAS